MLDNSIIPSLKGTTPAHQKLGFALAISINKLEKKKSLCHVGGFCTVSGSCLSLKMKIKKDEASYDGHSATCYNTCLQQGSENSKK